MGAAEKIIALLVSIPLPLILGILAIIAYIAFSRKSKSKSPFTTQVSAPTPLDTDPKSRDKVLRQNFKPESIPNGLDAIVVGSGIGGLTTAALMAKAGKKVLVLEQHDRAGGCTHTFVEQGFEFDIGTTVQVLQLLEQYAIEKLLQR